MLTATPGSHTKMQQNEPWLLLLGGTNKYSWILTVGNETMNYRFQSIFWSCNNNHRVMKKEHQKTNIQSAGAENKKAGKQFGASLEEKVRKSQSRLKKKQSHGGRKTETKTKQNREQRNDAAVHPKRHPMYPNGSEEK